MCDDDETNNHIIIKCGQLAQKESITTYNWAGKVILSDLCKKLKFDHSTICTNQNQPTEWDSLNSLGLWDTNGSSNPNWKTRPRFNE